MSNDILFAVGYLGLLALSLYFYDNNTFIAGSFLDKEIAINIVTPTQQNKITDISRASNSWAN